MELGRSPHAGVRVDDRYASRIHRQIDVADGEIVVRDSLSRHGTHLNGQSIVEKILRSSDKLQVGLTTFTVELDREERERIVADKDSQTT